MVGRERELVAAASAVAAMRDGPFGCVVHGAAGIGKTTVWRQALVAAESLDYRILCCRPTAAEAMFSFVGLGDLLDRLPDEALAALPVPQRHALEVALLRADADAAVPDHRAVRVGVLQVVRTLARDSPVLIAIDDAQWLDPSTAAVVDHLVRRLDDEPVGLLIALRQEADDPSPFGLDRALPPDRVRRIGLGGLSLGALHTLVRGRTGLALTRPTLHLIERAAEGNPFYALEIAGALARSGGQPPPGDQLPIPDRLSELVVGRIAALPAEARTALAVVATMVQPTLGVVREVLTTPADRNGFALAVEHGIVEVGGDRVRFTHPLLASAIQTTLSPTRRRQLHRHLATVVHDPEQRAWHLSWMSSDPDGEVAAALETAAVSAHARGAPCSAAQFWELASLRTPDGQARTKSLRLAAAGTCLFHAGDAPRARGLLEASARALPSGHDRAGVLVELAEVIFYQGNPREAVQLCEEASDQAGADRSLRVAARLCGAWYGTHDARFQLRRIESAHDLLLESDAETDPDLYACVILMTEYYRFYNGLGLDLDRIEKVYALLDPDSLSWKGSWASMIWCGIVKLIDPGTARQSYLAAYDRHHEVGDEISVATTLMHLAEIDCRLGEPRRALRRALRSIELLDQSGQRRWRGFALYAKGLAEAQLGELDAARASANEALELAVAISDPWVSAMQYGLLGSIEFFGGDLARADDHFTSAERLIDEMGVVEPARHPYHGDQFEVLIARGDLHRADGLLDRLQARAAIAPYPWLLATTARCRGIRQLAAGDLDAAAAALEQALQLHDDLGMPFERARTLLVRGRLLRRRRERLAARGALVSARQLFADLGATPWTARADEELGRLGLRRGTVGELTPTEERIARLAAAGLSNREVAASTFTSTKTVEATLGRVYRKLGVRSRRDLRTMITSPTST